MHPHPERHPEGINDWFDPDDQVQTGIKVRPSNIESPATSPRKGILKNRVNLADPVDHNQEEEDFESISSPPKRIKLDPPIAKPISKYGKSKPRPQDTRSPFNSSKEVHMIESLQSEIGTGSLFAQSAALWEARKLLPVWSHSVNIRRSLRNSDVLLLSGATGSGKSTQIPQILITESWCLPGYGLPGDRGGRIAVTEPRKVAATSLARRVAEELGSPLGYGGLVGYSVRFDSCVGSKNRIKFLTEGMLLREILRDPWLFQYEGVIVDEVHERGVDVDLVLGFLKKIVDGKGEGRGGRRLKVVVMSATADMERLKEFFGDGSELYYDTSGTNGTENGYNMDIDESSDLGDSLKRLERDLPHDRQMVPSNGINGHKNLSKTMAKANGKEDDAYSDWSGIESDWSGIHSDRSDPPSEWSGFPASEDEDAQMTDVMGPSIRSSKKKDEITRFGTSEDVIQNSTKSAAHDGTIEFVFEHYDYAAVDDISDSSDDEPEMNEITKSITAQNGDTQPTTDHLSWYLHEEKIKSKLGENESLLDKTSQTDDLESNQSAEKQGTQASALSKESKEVLKIGEAKTTNGLHSNGIEHRGNGDDETLRGSCRVDMLNIEGRQFPVKVNYASEPVQDIVEASANAIFHIHYKEPMPGDVLVFLTGQQAVETLCRLINSYIPGMGPGVPKIKVIPLYAALPQATQQIVFAPAPPRTRKIIISTNIAETSITVPGVRFVIDCGKAKVKQFRTRIGLQSLLVKPISKSAAIQRMGRAGREAPGECYRLYTETNYLAFDESNTPEILRCDLSHTILTIKALGVDNVLNFPFVDQPPREAIEKAILNLWMLGALNDSGTVTKIGHQMARFPLSVELGRALLAAAEPENTCVLELIDVIACLSVENVFKQLDSEEKQDQAESARRNLHKREGDHLTLLATVQAYAAEQSDRTAWTNRHFVSHRAMRAVMDVRKQLRALCVEMKIPSISADTDERSLTMPGSEGLGKAILKSLLKGFAMNTAALCPDGSYKTLAGKQTVAIHPSSVLFGRKVEAIVFSEFVYTTKSYARGVSAVQLDWIQDRFAM